MYEKIKQWYEQKLWDDNMVLNAVTKGIITQEQANEIMKI